MKNYLVNELKRSLKFLINEFDLFEKMKQNRIETIRFKKKMEYKGDKEEEIRYFPVIFMDDVTSIKDEVTVCEPYALAIFKLEKYLTESGTHNQHINLGDYYINPKVDAIDAKLSETYTQYIMKCIAKGCVSIPKGSLVYPFRNNVVFSIHINAMRSDAEPAMEFTGGSEIDELFSCSANYIAMLRNNLKEYIGYEGYQR